MTAEAMPRGFVALMLAQFVSALADNAVLIVAIALLAARGEPVWMAPLLKFGFIASYVVFALVVGVLADAWSKPRVMMATNALKAVGCAAMLAGVHPLAAYAVIGFGAAAYSPAKYGLMVELLPPGRLVAANAWLEALTIASVILGTLTGGMLIAPEFATLMRRGFDAFAPSGATPLAVPKSALAAALVVVLLLYALAALANRFVPDSGRRYRLPRTGIAALAGDFGRALRTLARDREGRVSLAVTSLLWGVGTALQFVVLDWGCHALALTLDRASMLQGVVAIGVAAGAVLAARTVPLARAPGLLPFGMLFGPLLLCMLAITRLHTALPMMAVLGAVAGFFIVPMNALLQHRGVVLLNAGQSIAVQNFCENLSVMVMLALYAGLRRAELPLPWIIAALAAWVSLAMAAIVVAHRGRAPRAA